MTDHTSIPTVATGDWIDAAWMNQYLGDNFRAIFQGLAAGGDMPYAVDANTVAALAKPSVDSVMKNTSGGVPSWIAPTLLAGSIHTKGTAFTNTLAATTSASYTTIGGGALRVDLVLTATCTIYAFAFGTAYTNNGLQDGFFIFQINTVTDANGDNVRVKYSANTPFSAMSRATGVVAGTRRVELLWKIAAGDQINLQSCVLYAIAVAE